MVSVRARHSIERRVLVVTDVAKANTVPPCGPRAAPPLMCICRAVCPSTICGDFRNPKTPENSRRPRVGLTGAVATQIELVRYP